MNLWKSDCMSPLLKDFLRYSMVSVVAELTLPKLLQGFPSRMQVGQTRHPPLDQYEMEDSVPRWSLS